MVRTYAFNASMQSDQRDVQRNAFRRSQNSLSSSQTSSSYDTVTRSVTESSQKSPMIQRREYAPSQTTLSAEIHNGYSPFHSPYVDPVGSIVGLRLLIVDGKLAYVPVEPQLNYLINQQFGGHRNQPRPYDPLQLAVANSVNNNNTESPILPVLPQQRPQSRKNVGRDLEYNQRQITPEKTSNKSFGSLPNIAQRSQLSLQEQHKLDLEIQIAENRKRKEEEKRKEYELEQREIRRFQEYNDRIRREEEEEELKLRQKAQALQRRSRQVYDEQAETVRQPERPRERRTPQNERPPRVDSSLQREVEWWEKKPSWQQSTETLHSAVIPTLRNRQTPSQSRSVSRQAYDPAQNAQERLSRASSRADSKPPTSQSRISEPVGQQSRQPIAFTIDA